VRAGDADSIDAVLEIVYGELRAMAQHRLAQLAPGQTLQAKALVHEAWLKLAAPQLDFAGRAHFFGAAARAMRNILVDQARRKGAQRRGAGVGRIEIDTGIAAVTPSLDDTLAVDEALSRLEVREPRKVRLVELRVFAGLSMPEVAEALGIALSTAERDWRFTRAWLARELDGGAGRDDRG